MSDTVPTVTVVRGGVEFVINKSDFDPAKDQMLGGAPPAPPIPPTFLVSKMGKAFFVVDVQNNKINSPAFDSDKGYASEPDAWSAIMTATSAPAVPQTGGSA